MDSITIGQLQCARFLIKAAQEMIGKTSIGETPIDRDTEKHLLINLTIANGSLATALNTIEEAVKGKAGAD